MENRIEKRIELKAPVSRVWQALTDYREFGEWFGAKLDRPFVPGQVSRGRITYAALGDETRLSLITRLCSGQPRSISQLTEGSRLTRQAITKHLRVLESAGIVHSVRTGRESRFELDPQPLDDMKRYLDRVSQQW